MENIHASLLETIKPLMELDEGKGSCPDLDKATKKADDLSAEADVVGKINSRDTDLAKQIDKAYTDIRTAKSCKEAKKKKQADTNYGPFEKIYKSAKAYCKKNFCNANIKGYLAAVDDAERRAAKAKLPPSACKRMTLTVSTRGMS